MLDAFSYQQHGSVLLKPSTEQHTAQQVELHLPYSQIEQDSYFGAYCPAVPLVMAHTRAEWSTDWSGASQYSLQGLRECSSQTAGNFNGTGTAPVLLSGLGFKRGRDEDNIMRGSIGEPGGQVCWGFSMSSNCSPFRLRNTIGVIMCTVNIPDDAIFRHVGCPLFFLQKLHGHVPRLLPVRPTARATAPVNNSLPYKAHVAPATRHLLLHPRLPGSTHHHHLICPGLFQVWKRFAWRPHPRSPGSQRLPTPPPYSACQLPPAIHMSLQICVALRHRHAMQLCWHHHSLHPSAMGWLSVLHSTCLVWMPTLLTACQ